jgi:streptogramin lyase
VWGLGASPDGGFWAILAESIGQFDRGMLAHYRAGTWTTVPELADVDPYDTAVTPAGSVCRIEEQGPTLVCVDPSLRVSRTPVAMTGNVTVAADGSVWVTDGSALARLPITVPD